MEDVIINVLKKKLDENTLKNKIKEIPKIVIMLPPTSSFFQAINVNAIRASHGIALGLFLTIPLSPPPNSSEPETKANRNTTMPIRRREYLAETRKKMAAFNFEFILFVL